MAATQGEAERIDRYDDRYDAIRKLWERNGRPWQFDREDRNGGAIYHAHVAESDPEWPVFFVHASAGPTLYPDDDQPGDQPTQKGWAWLVRRTGYLKIQRLGPRNNARLKITRFPLPRQ